MSYGYEDVILNIKEWLDKEIEKLDAEAPDMKDFDPYSPEYAQNRGMRMAYAKTLNNIEMMERSV